IEDLVPLGARHRPGQRRQPAVANAIEAGQIGVGKCDLLGECGEFSPGAADRFAQAPMRGNQIGHYVSSMGEFRRLRPTLYGLMATMRSAQQGSALISLPSVAG